MEKLGLEGVFDIAGFSAGIAQYQAGLGAAESQTERTGGTLGKLGGAFGSVAQGALSFVAGGLINKGIGLIGDAISGVTGAMIGGNAEFERYTTQFGVLLGSTDLAKQRLAELADFGARTPFELPEVVRADKILQAFGLHSEESAKKFGMSGTEIRTIAGDTAAGTGASFEEISTYLGKFASGATGEAISRMQELGIVTREQLSKMGLEFSKSGQLTSPLDQSMTVLLKAMKEKFGGMMDAQSLTFEGMVSNLQDWIGQTGRIIGAPIFDVLKQNLQGLLAFLGSDAVKGALTGFANAIAGGIQAAITTISNVGKALAPTIDAIGDFLSALQAGDKVVFDSSDEMSRFAEVLATLGVPDDLAMQISDFAGGVSAAFEMMYSDLQSGEPISETAAKLVGNIGQAFGLTEEQALSLGDAVGEALTPLAGIVDGLKITVEDLFTRLALGKDPLFILQGLFADLGMAFGLTEEEAGNLASIVTTSITSIYDIINTDINQAILVLASLKPIFDSLMAIIASAEATVAKSLPRIQEIFSQASVIIQNVIKAVSAVVQAVFGEIAKFLEANGDDISKFIGDTWNTILDIIQLAMKLINATIVPALNAIAKFIQTHSDDIQSIFKSVWNIISTIISTVLGVIRGIIQTVLQLVQGDTSGAMETLKGTFNLAWEGIKTIVSNAIGIVRTVLETQIQAAKDSAERILNSLKDKFNEIGESIKSGVSSKFEEVKNSITGSVQNALNGIGDLLGKFYDKGKEIVNNIVGGINNIKDNITNTITGIINGAVSGAVQAVRNAIDGIQNTINGIWGAIQSIRDAISGIHLPNPFGGSSNQASASLFAGASAKRSSVSGAASVYNTSYSTSYNLNVNSTVPVNNISQQFAIMEALAAG